MNEDLDGPVQLAGRGLTYKPGGLYVPGEYQILDNLDITPDGTVRSRRGMVFCNQETGPNPYTGFRKFIGHYGSFPVWTDDSDKIVISFSSNAILNEVYKQPFSFADVLADIQVSPGVAFTRWEEDLKCEGFWHYNGADYYLFLYYTRYSTNADPTNMFKARRVAVFRVVRTFNEANEIGFASFNFGAGDWVLISSESTNATSPEWFGSENQWPSFFIKSHLLFKERAWVATEDTVYFSKATDPLVWAAPSGGFFKFPNQEIKDIVALEDSIYVFCDSSIYSISYATDPNVDSEVNLISSNIGGESACILGNVIYTLKDDSIYAISGNNISKVLDLYLNLAVDAENTNAHSFSFKLVPFDDELYVFMRKVTKTDNGAISIKGIGTSYSPLGFMSLSGDQFDLYKINLQLGTFCSISVEDSFLAAMGAASVTCVPVDAYYVPAESRLNQSCLYFAFDYEDNLGHDGYVVGYPRSPYQGGNYIFNDSVLTNDFLGSALVTPSFRLKIRDFSPDGLMYQMKKFRNILLQSNIPKATDAGGNVIWPSLNVYFDDLTVATIKTLIERTTSDNNSQVGYRYGLNQRARKVSLEVSRPAVEYIFAANNPWTFELADLRILWSPTRRGPERNV